MTTPSTKPSLNPSTKPSTGQLVSKSNDSVVSDVQNGKTLDIEVRVRYCECDPMNVAHHSVFPVWMEIARTELLRSQGSVYRDLEEKGVFFAVIDMAVKYRRPARYDDLLSVHVRELPGHGGKRAKVQHDYEIRCNDQLLATASTTLACINRQGRPIAIPQGVMD